jgi:peptidylprolyl isomerase
VLHRLRRPAVLVLPLLWAATLAACGDDAAPVETARGFDAVSVSGEPGKVPEIEWKAMLEPGDKQVEVLEEGDGPVLEKGDKVLVNWAVSDEYTQAVTNETYGADQPALELEVGAEPASPPPAPVDLLTTLVNEQIEPGTTKVGTRIAMTVDADSEWGDDEALEPYVLSLAQYGIGNEDGFVIVADLAATPLPGPGWAPRVVQQKGKPTALDTKGLPEPDAKSKKLAKAVVVQGTGPAVEKGDLVVVNYLGQVWGGAKPFDESFSKEPFATPIGLGSVVKGWDQGLVGVPVGSRVLLRIPPALGYGDQAQGEAIPANSTLYFVIDVLAAA